MARRLAICLVLGILSGAGARTSAEPPGATLHLVALDGRGQGIRNLSASDLEIIEQGQARRISSLTFRGAASRQIALFLDEYHVLAGEHSERVKAAAQAFTDAHVRSEDTLFVMRPLDSQQAIAPVPSLGAARERIESFDGRKGQYEPRSEFEAEYLSAAPAAVARERRQIVRSAVQALATAMRHPGDTAAKALVVVTEGFESDERGRLRGTTTLRTIARVARLADIPVYVIDPSSGAPQPTVFNETWQRVATETGGAIMEGINDTHAAFARVAADLDAQYLLKFESSGTQDGAFHGLQVKLRRRGGSVRAPAGYWAPFPPSTFTPMAPRINYAKLLTPHFSGLIQPWFRMSPGPNGTTRVTFLWTHRPSGTKAHVVQFQALTFEGDVVHDSTLHSRRTASAQGTVRTEFDVAPGPLQVAMAISTSSSSLLATDVRYIEVPKLDPAKPAITAIEFVRPRSLPEFNELQNDPGAVPTEVRDFVRQDRLLVRVRAYAGQSRPDVQVRLLNRRGDLLLELPLLSVIDDATQFELPFARFPKAEYRLEVRATGAGTRTSQIVPVRVIG